MLISFPFGRCVNKVVDSPENYEGYRYDVHFPQCHTLAVIHSVNGEGVLDYHNYFWYVQFEAQLMI